MVLNKILAMVLKYLSARVIQLEFEKKVKNFNQKKVKHTGA